MTPQSLTGDERNRIRLYFLDSRLRYGLILLVAGLVLVELTLGRILLLAGLTWLGAVLALAAVRPSEEELDRLLSRDLSSLIETATRALDRPGDEVQVPPLALLSPSPLVARAAGLRSARPRSGRDGRLRSPVNRAVILLPMEDQLGLYSCDQNAVTGQTSNVSVEEHHYRDTVSVRMEEDLAPGTDSARRTASTQRLSLELTNGRTVAVPVAAAWQPSGGGGGALGPTELEKTLSAIRALLRDKR
ncbi:MAG TPA: hypothetical protein VLB76_01340 [Thermoanaerobaculia bacterium]|jgi:hypothetical protein|nr:hypothetical protein [Thermoanaerobaculia bacterium]